VAPVIDRDRDRPLPGRGRPMFVALSRAQVRADATLARHGWNVGWLAFIAAGRAGVPYRARPALFRAGVLHDFGKLWVDRDVLAKPGKLTDGEWEQVRRHVQYAEAMLSAVGLDAEAFVAMGHHERPDGQGYPLGLGAGELTTPVRVLSCVDAFCAMVEPRGYAPAVPATAALAELAAGAGTQFDPVAVDAVTATVSAHQTRAEPLIRAAGL